MTGRLDSLLYAQSWEDVAVLRSALRIVPTDDVLSISASGDNTLALLLDDPRTVTAVDRNSAQTHLVQLKMACLRTLDREDALELLGAAPTVRRRALYEVVRAAMPPESRAFWQRPSMRAAVRDGVLGAGRFERYLGLFRTRVLPLVHDAATVEELLSLADPVEQRRFYRERWDTWRWRALFRLFFGQSVMRRLGRDPSFFAHVDVEDVADVFRARARWALSELPVRENPYVSWILAGAFRAPGLLPLWLQPGHYETIAGRLGRVTVVQDDLGEHLARAADGAYSAFYLSDLFEYLSEVEADAVFYDLARVGRDGARLCYWNLLVPRAHPTALDGRIVGDPELSERLHRQDRTFFYRSVVVETLCPA